MKIGFTGTRRGMTDVQACVFEGLITLPDSFHHGGCRGADVQAARIVRKSFVPHVWIVCHPGPSNDPNQEASGVDDETLPPLTHFARNRDIVNFTDILIATPYEAERQTRGGTWYTVDYARKKGRRVIVITPDGGIEEVK